MRPELAPALGIASGIIGAARSLGAVPRRPVAEVNVVDRWNTVIHIDENLPLAEKEKLLFPIFPWTVKYVKNSPATLAAIETIKRECNLGERITYQGLKRWQRWIYANGTYQRSEGRYLGEDRFRTLSRLMSQRRTPPYVMHYDCVAEGERVLVTNGATYGSVPIERIEPGGDWKAVAYNWSERRFVTREFLRLIPKGPLDGYRVYLKNGTSFVCTADHEIFQHWVRQERGEKRVLVKERGLLEAYRNPQPAGTAGRSNTALATALELPEIGNPPPMSDAELWVLGSYIAEGWTNNQGIVWVTSGHEPFLPRMLESAGLDFTEHPNGHGVPQFYLRKNDHNAPFHRFLAECGAMARGKRLPPWFFGLNRRAMRSVLAGYASGDATSYGDEVPHSRRLTHNTASRELAAGLRIAHLVLGEPLYTDYTPDSKSAANTPMWRLHDNPASHFRKPFGDYKGLGATGIAHVEAIGKVSMYDVTVDVDHNFILADSGTIVSNCDDFALSTAQILDHYKQPSLFVLVSQQPVAPEEGISPLHHILPAFRFHDRWWLLEGIPLPWYGKKIPPIVPIEAADKIFQGLQRVVLVHPDGTPEEFEGWGGLGGVGR